MKYFVTIIFYSLLTITINAQPTIEIYLTTHAYPAKGSRIESTEETFELMIQDVTSHPFKITKQFDKDGNIISEIWYGKTGGKQSETKWEYSQDQKLKKKTHRYFVNMLGWKIEEALLVYNDTTGYISEIRFTKNGIIQATSIVFCDSIGNPKEVRVLDDKGAFSMIEKIGYSPKANTIRVMLLKSTNQYLNHCTYPIDSTKPYQTPQVDKQYYPNGAVMLESLEKQTKTEQGYYYEYTYDDQGNWVTKDTYQVTFGKNKKIKDKKLEHKIQRTIKYY
jgi:hypothetical protein